MGVEYSGGVLMGGWHLFVRLAASLGWLALRRWPFNVKGACSIHAQRFHSRASCAVRKPPLRSQLRFADKGVSPTPFGLAGQVSFARRCKRNQKI
jgi:hypothetical protein